jgi:hypothetical protein
MAPSLLRSSSHSIRCSIRTFFLLFVSPLTALHPDCKWRHMRWPNRLRRSSSGYPPLRVACSGPRLFSRCSFAAHSSQTFCPHHSLLGIHRIRSAPPFRHGRHLDGVCRVCPFNRLAIIGELLLYIDSILCGICALHHLGGLLALAHRLADHRGCELWRGRAPRGCTACRPRSFCCARSCS